MIKIFLLIKLIFLFSCGSENEKFSYENENLSEPLSILAWVDNASPTNVDRIKYTIEYSYKDGVSFDPPEIGAEIASFRIVDSSREGPKKVGKRNILKMWYVLEPDVDGTYILPPVVVKYKFKEEEKTINTNPIYINVAVAEIKGEEKIIENDDLADIPDDRLWFYSLITLGFLLIIALIIFIFLKWSKRERKLKALTPYEVAQKNLKDLKSNDFISKNEFRKFYFSLSEIVRKYIDGCFFVNTLESTQEEIVGIFKKNSNIKEEYKKMLLSFFNRSDFIKFAKELSTEKSAQEDLISIESFIEETNAAFTSADDSEDKGKTNV